MPAFGGAPGIRGPMGLRSFRSPALSTVTLWTAIEWDVFEMLPGATVPTYLATLYEASQKSIRVERHGPGAGSFAINRSSPECTEAILAQGNLVKVRIPEIWTDYIFAFFLETGDFTLISSQEAGGEMLTFGGRGILSYLEYARAAHASFIAGGQDPIAGVWRASAAGTGAAPGQILRRMIEEFQHVARVYPVAASHPLPLLTIDFDYANDSTAAAWDTTAATDEFAYQIGEDGLAISARLWETDTIVMQMAHDFLLSAYNPANFGRDLRGDAFGAGVVRFEKGVNIATELRRELAVSEVHTHMLSAGEADSFGGAVLSDAAARVTKEGFVPSFGAGATALNGVAAAELQTRLNRSDIIQFPIANRRTVVSLAEPITVGAVLATPGLATAGYYLPGPPGTNGDFWVGDTVRVHTGSGAFDYDEVDVVMEAITITREDDNHELIVIPELMIVPAPPVEQYFTYTAPAALGDMTWPQAVPGAGHLFVGFIACRGQAGVYTDFIPWSVPSLASGAPDIIAGTNWTHVTGAYVDTSSSYPIAMVYRYPTTVDDTLFPLVVGIGGGTGRPRGHFIETDGWSGAPIMFGSQGEMSTAGSTFISPNITVPGAGRIFAGMSYRAPGPADGSSAAFVMEPVSPAVTLTRGYASGEFAPYSWFGYLDVASAGTYNISLIRSAVPRNPTRTFGWSWAFWPNA